MAIPRCYPGETRQPSTTAWHPRSEKLASTPQRITSSGFQSGPFPLPYTETWYSTCTWSAFQMRNTFGPHLLIAADQPILPFSPRTTADAPPSEYTRSSRVISKQARHERTCKGIARNSCFHNLQPVASVPAREV